MIEEYRNGTREPGEKAKEAGFTSYTDYDDIFGDAPYREVTDPWQIRPEDLVQDPGHWYIAVKSACSSPYQNYPCTQSVGGGKAGFIGWGDPGIFIDDNTIAIYTRYPD